MGEAAVRFFRQFKLQGMRGFGSSLDRPPLSESGKAMLQTTSYSGRHLHHVASLSCMLSPSISMQHSQRQKETRVIQSFLSGLSPRHSRQLQLTPKTRFVHQGHFKTLVSQRDSPSQMSASQKASPNRILANQRAFGRPQGAGMA